MSLIIATGSNLNDRNSNLKLALRSLSSHFNLIAKSRVYKSPAVDYENQPDFYNQVLEFEIPIDMTADKIMDLLLDIEVKLGRIRNETAISKGPRTIDLDILFLGLEHSPGPKAIIPHPRLFERSFVVLPLSELPFFSKLKEHFDFSFKFSNHAEPISGS